MASPGNQPFAAPARAAAINPYAAPKAILGNGPDDAEAALAPRYQRLRAAIIDYLIYLVAGAVGGLTMAVTQRMGAAIVAGLLVFFAIVAWNAVLLARHGQTVGKKASGIRVVRTDGSDAGFARLFFLRAVVTWIITALPTIGQLFWLVDMLFIFREDRRCLHDLMADTKVVEAT